MRRFYSAIVGTVLVLAAGFFGCGGDSGPAPGEGFLDSAGGGSSAVQFKPTDLTPLNPMINQMKENMKKRDYTKKSAGAKDAKAAEKK